jgi:hypothetical protein
MDGMRWYGLRGVISMALNGIRHPLSIQWLTERNRFNPLGYWSNRVMFARLYVPNAAPLLGRSKSGYHKLFELLHYFSRLTRRGLYEPVVAYSSQNIISASIQIMFNTSCAITLSNTCARTNNPCLKRRSEPHPTVTKKTMILQQATPGSCLQPS